MRSVAEEIEKATEGPHVSLLCHGLVAIQVHHLRRAVHRCGVTVDLDGGRGRERERGRGEVGEKREEKE